MEDRGMVNTEESKQLVLGMDVTEEGFDFTSSIGTALASTEAEIDRLEETIK